MTTWIKTSDELPKKYEKVLFCYYIMFETEDGEPKEPDCINKLYAVGYVAHGYWSIYHYLQSVPLGSMFTKVTHWMELPRV